MADEGVLCSRERLLLYELMKYSFGQKILAFLVRAGIQKDEGMKLDL